MMIEEPVVAVHIPTDLRPFTQGRDEVMASGDTVQDVLESLDNEHPGVLSQLLSAAGEVQPTREIWLGGSDTRALQGLATPVGLEELVSIVNAPAAEA